jgi:uncharacterized protein (TIGR00369 family)
MTPRDPRYAERVQAIFDAAPFIGHLGIELRRSEPGFCETLLRVKPFQLQQDGFIHAGVQTTLADHTAGAAAGTLMAAEDIVLTVNLSINLLRPARGEELWCRARVLRPGAQITVVESEVLARSGAEEKLTAKATITLAYVPVARSGR